MYVTKIFDLVIGDYANKKKKTAKIFKRRGNGGGEKVTGLFILPKKNSIIGTTIIGTRKKEANRKKMTPLSFFFLSFFPIYKKKT